MRITIRILILSILLALAGMSAGASVANAADPPASPKVLKRPVTFLVNNVNRSILPCPSDGAAYEVKGHLIGPASEVGPGASGERRSTTLYLHGFGFGEFFWSFSAVPRYDYAAAMGRAGRTSVVIDRLGYGSSGHPQGNQTCLGAQADVAHQVVDKLRSGDYVAEGGDSPALRPGGTRRSRGGRPDREPRGHLLQRRRRPRRDELYAPGHAIGI